MQDKDPRPMPIEVQSAYRDPIDLLGLLATDVYSPADRIAVRDALLSSLLATYGDAWVEAGSKEVRVTTHVKAFRKNIVDGVEMLLDVPDYRGREETLSLLAQAMQSLWAAWWQSFVWGEYENEKAWSLAAQHVLGQRQFAWLAAQYARSVIDLTRPQDREVCLRAIKSAETWARVPSEQNRQAAYGAANSVARPAVRGATATAALHAANIANAAADAILAAYGAANANAAAANAAILAAYAANIANAGEDPCAAADDGYLANLTRLLMTPTLVTSASRELRAPAAMHFV